MENSVAYGRLLLTGAAGALGRVLRPPMRTWAPKLRVSDIAHLDAPQGNEEAMPCDLGDERAMRKLLEGVDAVGARLMKDILLDQVRHGATIFLTSHVLEVVERLCDHAAIINKGRIVAEGRMQDLHTGSETLEDVFVRIVGRGREYDKLEWLG